MEVGVTADGRLEGSRVVSGAPPFDEAAVQALRRWVFRPARLNGRAVASTAYAVFLFRRPLALPAPPRR